MSFVKRTISKNNYFTDNYVDCFRSTAFFLEHVCIVRGWKMCANAWIERGCKGVNTILKYPYLQKSKGK